MSKFWSSFSFVGVLPFLPKKKCWNSFKLRHRTKLRVARHKMIPNVTVLRYGSSHHRIRRSSGWLYCIFQGNVLEKLENGGMLGFGNAYDADAFIVLHPKFIRSFPERKKETQETNPSIFLIHAFVFFTCWDSLNQGTLMCLKRVCWEIDKMIETCKEYIRAQVKH